jgi:hypothetical protein
MLAENVDQVTAMNQFHQRFHRNSRCGYTLRDESRATEGHQKHTSVGRVEKPAPDLTVPELPPITGAISC